MILCEGDYPDLVNDLIEDNAKKSFFYAAIGDKYIYTHYQVITVRFENKIPPPLIALFFSITMWFLSSGVPDSVGAIRIMCIILCIILGCIFSLSALAS